MRYLLYTLAGFGGLVLLALITLFIMSHRRSAGAVAGSIEINSPPEEVWLWISEPQRLKQWVSWLVEVRPENDVAGVGGKRTWVMDDPNMKQMVEIQGEVTRYDPPHQLEIHIDAKMGFSGDMTYTLTDLGGGKTRLDTAGKYSYNHWFARLMEPVVTPQAKKKQRADLETLKRKAESGA